MMSTDEISIPYGSIKRILRNGIKLLDDNISIPYGSIKSFSNQHSSLCDVVFQFLMVQLKAPTVIAVSLMTIFQFLMVQLKVQHV